MAGLVKEISDAEFDAEVLKASGLVLVDFWAPWCGPCKTIAPVLEELASQFKDSLKVVKVDVDQNPQSPTKYGVRGIPFLVFIKGGEVVYQLTGARPKDEIVGVIQRHIA